MPLPTPNDVIESTFQGHPVLLNKTMPIDKGGWGEREYDVLFVSPTNDEEVIMISPLSVEFSKENDNAITFAE